MTSKFPFMVGYELEGKFKNIKTIFVTGIQNIDDIYSKVIMHPDIYHLYFDISGCAKDFDMNIINKFSKYLVTIEINYDEIKHFGMFPRNVHLMIKYPGDGLSEMSNQENITVKLEDTNQNIFCMPLECFISNDYSKYFEDVAL